VPVVEPTRLTYNVAAPTIISRPPLALRACHLSLQSFFLSNHHKASSTLCFLDGILLSSTHTPPSPSLHPFCRVRTLIHFIRLNGHPATQWRTTRRTSTRSCRCLGVSLNRPARRAEIGADPRDQQTLRSALLLRHRHRASLAYLRPQRRRCPTHMLLPNRIRIPRKLPRINLRRATRIRSHQQAEAST